VRGNLYSRRTIRPKRSAILFALFCDRRSTTRRVDGVESDRRRRRGEFIGEFRHLVGVVCICRLTWVRMARNRRSFRDDWLCRPTITNHIQSTQRPLVAAVPPNGRSPAAAARRGFPATLPFRLLPPSGAEQFEQWISTRCRGKKRYSTVFCA